MEAAANFQRAHCKTICEITVGKVILATMEKGICTPNQKNTQTVHAACLIRGAAQPSRSPKSNHTVSIISSIARRK